MTLIFSIIGNQIPFRIRHHRMRIHIGLIIKNFIVVCLLASALPLSAQNTDCEDLGITGSLNFNTTITPSMILPGQEFCIDFTVENFQNINTFQLTFNFDPTLIRFESFTDNRTDLVDAVLPNLMETDNGIITILWFRFATTGLTLPDGTVAFTICFDAQLEATDCVPFSITDALAPVFPASEVNYQDDMGQTCQDSIILINGMPSTCIEIACTDLAITNVGTCNTITNSGSIEFSACGGAAPYQYFISRLGGPPIITGSIDNDFEVVSFDNAVPPGTYQILIVDAMGNSTNQNVIIENIAPVSYDPLIAVDPICANLSNGSVTIENITSGFPGELFDVSFSNGVTYQDVTEATFERLFNGEYTITITDLNGCETEETITLFTPPIELDIDLEAASCFGAMDGSLMVDASGGTPFPNNEYDYNNVLQETFLTLTPFQDNAFNNLTNKYRLRVTDANGCSVEENIEIPVAQEIIVEFNNIEDIACKGDCDGSLSINTMTPGRYTFLVRDENNNFVTAGANDGRNLIFNGELCAGTYTVTVRDTSGCAKDTFFQIMEPADALIADPAAEQASCNTEDGLAIVNVSGGMAPYVYVWEDAPTNDNDSLTNVMAGTYNVMITDALGCVLDTFVEVISGDELEIEAFIADNLECDGSGTGQLDVNIINSTANDHDFEWTDEIGNVLATTQTLDFTGPGSYIVNVMAVGTDCEAMDTIIIDANPGLSLDIETSSPTCEEASDGEINIVNISGGIAPYECIWEDSNIMSCNPTGLMAGTYNLTIVDADGCEKDTFVELTAEIVDITFEILAVPPSCPGEMDARISIFNFLGGTAPYECNWEDNTINSCDPTGLAAGTYNLTITDANGCSKDTFAVIIDAQENISFDLDITNPECGGDLGSIVINNLDGANLPIDVSWSVAASGNSATDLMAGPVTISFEDARGCTRDTTINLITVDSDFELMINAVLPDCAVGLDNGSISFPGFDATTGTCEWGDPDLNAQNCTLIDLAPGIYNVTLTDVNGCQKDTFIDLTVPERLELEVDNIMDASCFGSNDGSAVAAVTNNPLNVTASSLSYFWTNPADNGTGFTDGANQLMPGTNSVYVFDGLCTSDTISFEIGEPDAIELINTDINVNPVVCFGECNGSASLEAQGGTLNASDYTFTWEDGFVGASRNDLCAGRYFITISDDNNCEFIDSIDIIEPDELLLSIDSTQLVLISCGNDDTGTLAVNTEGGCGDYSYMWTDDVSMSAIATGLSVGTYTITVTDACGCTAETSFEFESSTPVEAEAIVPDAPQCEGDQVCIGIESASGGTGFNYTYSVNFGNRIDIDSCIMVGPGTYTLLVFDSAGCSTELSVTVDSPQEFSVDLGEDILLDFGENQTEITAMTTGGTPSYTFDWFTDADFNCSVNDCSSIAVFPFTNTLVEVVVTDSNGCTAEDNVLIDIKTERNVYLPNVFNPESLPPNNKFMILTGRGVEEVVNFRVFDRWGNLMYEAENLQAPTTTEQGWDGRRGDGGNNKVEQGVYVYTAEVRFVDGVTLNYRGELTLIR